MPPLISTSVLRSPYSTQIRAPSTSLIRLRIHTVSGTIRPPPVPSPRDALRHREITPPRQALLLVPTSSSPSPHLSHAVPFLPPRAIRRCRLSYYRGSASIYDDHDDLSLSLSLSLSRSLSYFLRYVLLGVPGAVYCRRDPDVPKRLERAPPPTLRYGFHSKSPCTARAPLFLLTRPVSVLHPAFLHPDCRLPFPLILLRLNSDTSDLGHLDSCSAPAEPPGERH